MPFYALLPPSTRALPCSGFLLEGEFKRLPPWGVSHGLLTTLILQVTAPTGYLDETCSLVGPYVCEESRKLCEEGQASV